MADEQEDEVDVDAWYDLWYADQYPRDRIFKWVLALVEIDQHPTAKPPKNAETYKGVTVWNLKYDEVRQRLGILESKHDDPDIVDYFYEDTDLPIYDKEAGFDAERPVHDREADLMLSSTNEDANRASLLQQQLEDCFYNLANEPPEVAMLLADFLKRYRNKWKHVGASRPRASLVTALEQWTAHGRTEMLNALQSGNISFAVGHQLYDVLKHFRPQKPPHGQRIPRYEQSAAQVIKADYEMWLLSLSPKDDALRKLKERYPQYDEETLHNIIEDRGSKRSRRSRKR